MTMTETDDRHNGWTNRETWAFMLYVQNDEGLAESARENVARERLDAHRYAERTYPEWSGAERDAYIRSAAADALKYWAESLFTRSGYTGEYGDAWSDALADAATEIGSLWRINWDECVDALADPDDSDDGEYVEHCPACGEPIDYCQGHGEIGDPVGAAILAAHDDDDHSRCHPDGCDDVPAPLQCDGCDRPMTRATGCRATIARCRGCGGDYERQHGAVTCGHCDRSWCDGCDPTPSARCPWEADHEDDESEPMVETVAHSGAIIVSDIVGGYRIARTYYGYTCEEAVRAFRAETGSAS